MRPAGARASNPPTVQTGLWADLSPSISNAAAENDAEEEARDARRGER